MLLTMALLLAGVSAFLELKIPLLRRLNKMNRTFGIITSLVLSWWLGKMFGATGLVALMAGLMSTVLTEPIYGIMRWYAKTDVQVRQQVTDFRDTYRPVWSGIKIGFAILTSPIWLPVKARSKYLEVRGLR